MKIVIDEISNEDLFGDGMLYVKGVQTGYSKCTTVVGKFAGEKCDDVKFLIIGTGIKELEYAAFYYSKKLEVIRFSEGLEKIGDMAFQGCTSLKEVKLPKGLKLVDINAFDSCDLERVTFSETVSRIRKGAFTNNPNLKEVEVPYLCKVDSGAFDKGCVIKRKEKTEEKGRESAE